MPVHFDLGSPQSESTAAQIDGCFLTRGLCEYYQHCRCLRLPSIDKKHRPDTRKRSSGTQNSHGDWTYFEEETMCIQRLVKGRHSRNQGFSIFHATQSCDL